MKKQLRKLKIAPGFMILSCLVSFFPLVLLGGGEAPLGSSKKAAGIVEAFTAFPNDSKINSTAANVRIRKYTDRGYEEPMLKGFMSGGSFWGKRYSQRGKDKKGGSWVFRGGTYKAYYTNGSIKEERFYRRRQLLNIYELYTANGVWKFYLENGKAYKEEIYIDGKKIMVLNYGDNGKIISREITGKGGKLPFLKK